MSRTEQHQAWQAWEQARDAMHASREHLGMMLDSIPALAWACRPDGTTAFLNQRWLDYTGLSLAQALDGGWQGPIHPDDLGTLRETWARLLASGAPGEAEVRLRRFDGAYRWFKTARQADPLPVFADSVSEAEKRAFPLVYSELPREIPRQPLDAPPALQERMETDRII